MTSLQRITPAREQTLQTADDRGVYNDGKSNSFILIIKKKIFEVCIKSFSWRRLFIQAPIVGVYLGHYFFKLIFSLHARIITILCTINPFFLIILK